MKLETSVGSACAAGQTLQMLHLLCLQKQVRSYRVCALSSFLTFDGNNGFGLTLQLKKIDYPTIILKLISGGQLILTSYAIQKQD